MTTPEMIDAAPLQSGAGGNRCWLVLGAEARRAFAIEEEAVAFAGKWGKIIPMVEETPAPESNLEMRHGPEAGEAMPDNASETTGAPDLSPVQHLRWLPIERADKSVDRIYDLPGMPRPISNSEEYWCRDADGRVFLATWADDGKRAYWWDLDGESPVDPIEFMPHPLDTRFTTTEGSTDG